MNTVMESQLIRQKPVTDMTFQYKMVTQNRGRGSQNRWITGIKEALSIYAVKTVWGPQLTGRRPGAGMPPQYKKASENSPVNNDLLLCRNRRE